LDRCTDPAGTTHPIRVEDPELAEIAKLNPADPTFLETLHIVLRDPTLSLALRDLIDGMRQFHIGPINCARAIETIRNYFIPAGGERRDGWAPMQTALNVSESYLRFITNLSRDPRHGDRSYIPIDQTRLAGARAWSVMTRFLEYRRRGN
jgi:hypothetical protein